MTLNSSYVLIESYKGEPASCRTLSKAKILQASTFTVANLYYNHPILNILAIEFNVSNERASLVPTVMQAGYASGLLFLCPLGDIVRRRAFVLCLVFLTATIVKPFYGPVIFQSCADHLSG
jgi:MFS family permease